MFVCSQEHVAGICGPSRMILVQEPGEETDPEKVRRGKRL